jgi:ribonuclease HI
MTDTYSLNFDGCSKGNPGKAAAGAVIYKNNIEIYSISIFVGEKETNNVAEYTGLLIGLQEANKLGIKHLAVKGDSQLVIKQMNGEYQVKAPTLLKLFQKTKQLQKLFTEITFAHVYRTENKRADELANQGLGGHPLTPDADAL